MQNNQTSHINLNGEQQKKGRLVVISIVIFFLVPILVVVLMYKFNWKPSTGACLGQLVTPARLINMPSGLKHSDGQTVAADFWKDKWSIVYVAAKCEQACAAKLHDMRQIHVSLYKEMPRAQRVLITEQLDNAKYKKMYPELFIIDQPATSLTNLATQFNIGAESAVSSDRIFLVDPLGQIMMSYPFSSLAKDIRKDISQLLRYSWAG